MPSSIQRGGYWWNRRPDGVWLRWSAANASWEPQEGEPPPPGTPPPPPEPDVETVQRTPSGAKVMATAGSRPSPAAPAASAPQSAVPVASKPTSLVQASAAPQVAKPTADRVPPKTPPAAVEEGSASTPEVAASSRSTETAVEQAEAPATETSPQAETPQTPQSPSAPQSPQAENAPLPPEADAPSDPQTEGSAPAQPGPAATEEAEAEALGDQGGGSLAPLAPHPVAANAPVFSRPSGAAPRGMLENRGVLGTLAAVLVVLVFLGTYTGANLFFSEIYGPEVAHAEEKGSSKMSQAKRQYITKFDRACRRQSGSVAELQARLLTATSAAQMERVLVRLASLAKRSLERVSQWPKPKEDRGLLERILRLQRSSLPLLDRLLGAAQERNSAALDAIAAEAYATATEASRLMERYGFKVCGRS